MSRADVQSNHDPPTHLRTNVQLPNTRDYVVCRCHVVLEADVDVRVCPPSKFNNCPLFWLPGLVLDAQLKWICMGNGFNHHTVLPYAPDKMPTQSSTLVTKTSHRPSMSLAVVVIRPSVRPSHRMCPSVAQLRDCVFLSLFSSYFDSVSNVVIQKSHAVTSPSS